MLRERGEWGREGDTERKEREAEERERQSGLERGSILRRERTVKWKRVGVREIHRREKNDV